ncbi:histidine N-acetyltransferase [Xenopus laevis]|uniref:Histidine N-acetyltransferase n=1 Tax=Xenopus laevis TaxID=8355 RepID=A0A8J1MV19_XENLA|nr:histidine N-acetyltransferase [Xenopus laevis]XP_041444871.1 histidine N-acetyltransferase [Xenopus laevis]OCT59435.1 hypothetical protein XELAEV_18000857mg [Xenopus laevis]
MAEKSLLDVQIVPATASDYDEVLSISDGIYNGVDYLPFRYHEWVRDNQRRMFVAKSGGKVVGFDSYLLVDGGVTAVVQGLRVAPWMRGYGIAGVMQQFCFDVLRSEHPEVSKVRLTRGEDPPAAMLNKYRLVHSKAVISVVIPNDQLEDTIKLLKQRVENVDGKAPVFSRSPEEVRSWFENSFNAEGLFPKGILVQDWLPLSNHRSNLELLLQRGVLWCYSNSLKSSTYNSLHANQEPTSASLPHSSSLPNTFITSDSTCEFLSLGTPPISVPLEDGMHRYDIDLFGIDPVAAKAHILHQLTEALRVLPRDGGMVCLLYVEEILRAELTQFCQGITPFLIVKEQLVLEMDI